MGAEINKTESRNTIEGVSETESWFSENNNIDKLLAILTKEEREDTDHQYQE